MREGACKGTKGWTFNKKSTFFKKKHFTPQKLNQDAKPKKTWCLTIFMDRRHCQNSMGNIEQLVDPEGLITFFKYD